MTAATIGSIEPYALHDGPGIRTTVFFKGCALECAWCHNPELISPVPEAAFHHDRCIGCGDCLTACAEGAVSLDGVERIDRARCTVCGECARVCPGGALEIVGREYDIPELLGILLADRIFYENSGGGVTLSGGEPTSWIEFIEPLLRALKAEGIHTAIQTNGFFDWNEFEKLIPLLDLVFFDLKAADPMEHLSSTGVTNEPILANLRRIVEARPEDVIARIPLIPGYTATDKNITALADLARAMGVRRCSLPAYHPYGLSKAERIGKEAKADLPRVAMTGSEVRKWRRYFEWAELVEY